MNDHLADLRKRVEAACAERDRLWQEYCEVSKRELTARAALHEAVVSAAKGENDGRADA